MKRFSTKQPCELTVMNMDRGCGLDGCPKCGFGEEKDWKTNWNKLKIVAVCKAPWVGGLTKKLARPLALVYECQGCFEKSWFHTTKGFKETLEELRHEGIIK
jgi:hypothetical protein